MTVIVINRCYGGFGLSEWATKQLTCDHDHRDYKYRNCPELVRVVSENPKKASGGFADLEVYEIPIIHGWYIMDYDGIETIHEGRQWPSP